MNIWMVPESAGAVAIILKWNATTKSKSKDVFDNYLTSESCLKMLIEEKFWFVNL